MTYRRTPSDAAPVTVLRPQTKQYRANFGPICPLPRTPDGATLGHDYLPATGQLDLITLTKPGAPSRTLHYEYYSPAECSGGTCPTGVAPGKLKSTVVQPDHVTTTYTYDGMLSTGVAWSGSVAGAVAWSYDNFFRPITETVDAGTTTSAIAMGYDADSLLTCVSPSTCNPVSADALRITRSPQNALLTGTSMGSVTDSYTYNTYGEVAAYQALYGSTSLYSAVYDTSGAPRDALGRIVQKTETLQGEAARVLEYTYDVRGQLTDVVENGSLLEHYEYDGNGNRTAAVTPSGTLTSSAIEHDDQDRLLRYGSTTYTYNYNGDLETKTGPEGTTVYEYDERGALISVELSTRTEIEGDSRGTRSRKPREIRELPHGA